MKLVVFNGSPRRKKSNSKILMEQFLKGYNEIQKDDVPLYYLASMKRMNEYVDAFQHAQTVLFIFPLYTDSMPGVVKFFIEKISELKPFNTKNIGFIVQSGFPEAHHSTYLERYLEKWTRRIQCTYLGTVIRGGVEGIQIQPRSWTRKLFRAFYELGKGFADSGSFHPDIVARLRKPYMLSAPRRLSFRFMALIGLTNYYWNMKLKEHHAYDIRFDRPYMD